MLRSCLLYTSQMPHIGKSDPDSFTEFNFLIIITGLKQCDSIDGILYGIKWLYLRLTGSFALSVAPLCLKFLNVRTVSQHHITEIRGCKRRYNPAFESIFHQKW